ncbi:MAG: hypothetical protein ACAH80_16265 [Alphaproteobacteria bacterium]
MSNFKESLFPRRLRNAFKAAADDGRKDLGKKLAKVAGFTALGSAIVLAVGSTAPLPIRALSIAVGASVPAFFKGPAKAAYRAYKQTP